MTHKIGGLYKVKPRALTIIDNKTKVSINIERNEIITLVGFAEFNHMPIILCRNQLFELYFDEYFADSFDKFFIDIEAENDDAPSW